jgi:hypothetical protein
MSSSSVTLSASDTPDVQAGAAPARRLIPPVVMLALVGIAAALPLLRNTIFYFWDDTAGAAVPMFRRLGESILDGRLPLLQPDMWRGGAFAAEAATGIFNPLLVLLAVITYAIDNIALAITVIKLVFLLLMAGGTYLAAREYQVPPWIAAATGTAIPLTGQTFFWDASAWTYSLMATALVPWVLCALHRCVHHGGSPLLVVLAGYLCCSIGNPYGLAATAVLVLAFLIEAWLTGRRGRIVPVTLSGLAVGALSVVVYLPLVLTSPVGFRSEQATANDEFLSPSLTDLLSLSSPTSQPWVSMWGLSHLTVPTLYLAWFVLPLLPWLRWELIRMRARRLTALFVFGGVFTLLLLGPSQVWMFRWPLRLITFVWFPVILLWAILAGAGLARTRVRPRVVLSACLVLLGGYFAWSDKPDNIERITAGTLLVALLVGWLLWRELRRRAFRRHGLAPVLLTGTMLVLGLQLAIYPSMGAGVNYRFPTSQEMLRERFAKYHGVTVQVADVGRISEADRVPDRVYRDLLFGSMYGVAGVRSTTAYSGIGYTALDRALCMVYQGSVCDQAWQRLWRPVGDGTVPLVDLLRAETVVVQNNLVDTRFSMPPEGWRRAREAEESGLATVWRRIEPLPWPDGRVSSAPSTVRVLDDRIVDGTDERLSYQSDGSPGELTFALLNWPNYTATVNGRPTAVRRDQAGLVVVALPAGVTSGTVELTWRLPGAGLAATSAGFGLVLTVALIVAPALRRRRLQHPVLQ